MDAVPSAQADLRRSNFVSPVKGTHTLTVREYEQAIDKLKKENFDLKLRIYLLEETINKTIPKNKGDDQDNVVQVIVELKIETEALKNELVSKTQLLQDALEQAEKYSADLKELQEKFVQQQEQLAALQELPSAQEVRLILDERDSLLERNEKLSKQLSEKDADLLEANAQLDELSNTNKALESKVKKSSSAIQGIVYKYYKDIEAIPKEIRGVVESAVQAAKENHKEDLDEAVQNFKTYLSELLPTSVDGAASFVSDRRSGRKSSLKEDSMEQLQKSMGISKSFEVLNESSETSHSRSKLTHEQRERSSDSSLNKTYLTDQSSESLNEIDQSNGSEEDLKKMEDILRENENLKSENQERSQVIDEQNATINELEQRTIQLQSELLDAVSKVKSLEMKLREERSKITSSLPKVNSAVQTAIQWHLMQSNVSDKLLQNAGLSNNIDDLKEEILTLLLVIEQKDKEISDLEETLQEQMEKIENKKVDSSLIMDMDYLTERNELHQRLADCSAVNNDLLKHLRSLETFMENLLHNKSMNSSLESLNQSSDFLSQLTSCLDQTLKLSNVLSDHLSVCEGSKIFDPNDFTLIKEFDLEEKSSYPLTDRSQMSVDSSINQSVSQGRDKFQSSERDLLKNIAATGKRRLSFSNLQKSGMGSENMVVLGTSNNEDLILLLNDKGDPEDVLIRNNHSHLDKNEASFGTGDQLRRRCWDPSNTNQWNPENPSFSHHVNNWYASQLLNSNKIGAWYNHCPSSDSDIWSEPDRDVSLQRIGIDVQKSPVTQKSPRRSRFRGRSTDEPSSQKNESASSVSKLQTWSKRRRCSGTSKTSFICKKCMSQSQQMDDVTKEEKDEVLRELDSLTEKCNAQENQLSELHDLLQSKNSLISDLTEEKQRLLDCIEPLKKKLSALEEENELLENQLTLEKEENIRLREMVGDMDQKRLHYNEKCEDLKASLSETESKLNFMDKDEQKLLNNMDLLQRKLSALEDKNTLLENQNSEFSVQVTQSNEENTRLEQIIKDMEVKLSCYDVECKELKTELSQTKSRLAILDSKCSDYTKKLNQANDENLELRRAMGDMEEELSQYDVQCEELKTELSQTKSNLTSLDSKCSDFSDRLAQANDENSGLKRAVGDMKVSLSSSYEENDKLKTELFQMNSKLMSLDAECCDYKEKLSASSKDKEECVRQLQALESTKLELVREVEGLKLETNELLQKIQLEEENKYRLEKEKQELDRVMKEKMNLVSSLQLSHKDLMDKHASCLHEKEVMEKDLLSTSSAYNELKEEFEKTNTFIEDLKSKCSTYERELAEMSILKQEIGDKLTSFASDYVSNLNNLKNICNQCLNLDEATKDDSNLSLELLSDKNTQIEKQLEVIVSANFILEQRLSLLSEVLLKSKSTKEKLNEDMAAVQKQLKTKESDLEQLKSKIDDCNQKLEKYKNSNDQYKTKIKSYQHQLGLNENEMESLKGHSQELQNHIKELQHDIFDKEMSLEGFKVKETSLQNQVNLLQNQLENNQLQLDQKDDEITQLQERIFNLQTQINGLLSEKLAAKQPQSFTDLKISSKDIGCGSYEAFNVSRDIGSGSDEVFGVSRDIGSGSNEVLNVSRDIGLGSKEAMYISRDIGSGSKEVLGVSRESGSGSNEVLGSIRDIGSGSNEVLGSIRDIGSGSNEVLGSIRDIGSGSNEVLGAFRDIGSGSKEILYLSNASDSSRTDIKSRRSSDTLVSSGSERSIVSESTAYEQQNRKMKSLRTKLGISEKRIEILEKEKEDLREELMAQVDGSKKSNGISSDVEALYQELADIKGKLEAKTSFIRDLKNELQNSYNLLIEKQKEVDELSTYKQSIEAKSTSADQETLERFSDSLLLNKESNIKELKKHKWELIQDIFKQQKQFYERKNIHLGHFEKFRNHIEKLRSLQVYPLLCKSESAPLLNASSMSANSCYVEKCDVTLKNLQIELELDVECLQNFKIFLKRFFVPFVMQKCQCSKSDPKSDGSATCVKSVDGEEKRLSLQTKSVSDDKLVKSGTPKMSFEKSSSMEVLRSSSSTANDKLLAAASVISSKVDSIETMVRDIKSVCLSTSDLLPFSEETPQRTAAKSLIARLLDRLHSLQDSSDQISHLNSMLKTIDLVPIDIPKSPTKQDMSDRESLLSEETITLSRSGSLSPMSFEDHFPSKLASTESKAQDEPLDQKGPEDKAAPSEVPPKMTAAGGSQESIFQRSHFSSPDLGIESDPNHESSAPEQTEFRNSNARKWYDISSKEKVPVSLYSRSSTTSKLADESLSMTGGDSLHAIGLLQQYQLLKKEVQESFVGIKVILSRTDDGLHHVAKYTSPRKSIECTTFKAIRDESLNIEMCLKEAIKLVDSFWIAPCPSVEELKALLHQNQDLRSKLVSLQEAKKRQQSCFEQAMEKLKNAEVLRDNMEKNISRKLVKTKKVIREVENKMLHRKNQALPPIPKFPEETTRQSEL